MKRCRKNGGGKREKRDLCKHNKCDGRPAVKLLKLVEDMMQRERDKH